MDRHQMGSRLLQLKGIAIGLYIGFAWWLGLARTPLEKTIWGIIVLALVLWWSAGPVGYADEKGIHYRKLVRAGHVSWSEVKKVEWNADEMVLWLTADGTVLNFKYRGIAALFGSRQRPESVNFIERRLKETGPAGRFVCKTSLTA